MKFLDNLKDFFMPSEEEYMDNPEPSSQDLDQEPPMRESAARQDAPREERKSNRTLNIQTTAQLQVVLVKPEIFTDSQQIADHLLENKTVVLNLETASTDNKRRIIDFLAGVTYAQQGNLKRVANQTYIITPYNVGFVGDDLVGELENNGVIL
ncbi:cell division protein sepF [Ruminococcus sp. CAG:403]|nr:cell division protein SepF [Ruminococcus sp.]CDE34576.1 cell division protein sepF [Ruminococcus sp. CAG:403]